MHLINHFNSPAHWIVKLFPPKKRKHRTLKLPSLKKKHFSWKRSVDTNHEKCGNSLLTMRINNTRVSLFRSLSLFHTTFIYFIRIIFLNPNENSLWHIRWWKINWISAFHFNFWCKLLSFFSTQADCSRFNMKFSFDCWFRATDDLYYSNQHSLCVFIFQHTWYTNTCIHFTITLTLHAFAHTHLNTNFIGTNVYGCAGRATSCTIYVLSSWTRLYERMYGEMLWLCAPVTSSFVVSIVAVSFLCLCFAHTKHNIQELLCVFFFFLNQLYSDFFGTYVSL